MLWEMDISIISGQMALLHVRLEPGDGFEVYGGTSEDALRVERQDDEWLVTLDEVDVAGRPLVRFNVYARQVSTGREWAILGGKVLVSQRTATVPGDKLAPVEYFVKVPVLENAVDLTGTALVTGIVGPRGYSAYDIAVMEGFEGTEPEWLEYMRQQTATLAVEQVTPLMERAEAAAQEAENERIQAALYTTEARKQALAASDHATEAENQSEQAEDSRIQASREVAKATAEVEKAKQERETAAGHADAAAKSAQAALANKQDAEQAVQDAQNAKNGAEQAAANADASKSAAQTAEGNAAASANAAAASQTAAEKAKQDAQAAQTKAEKEALKAEQNAALLGDAALQGGGNVFSGENILTGSLSLAGNPAQAAEEMAYWPLAVQAFMVQCYDWSQFRKDFGKLTKPWRFPKDMPEPEQIRTTTNMRHWFNQGMTFTHFPDSWTFEGLTTIFETFSGNKQLLGFPAGVTFSNVTNISFGLNGCTKLVLSENMDFSKVTSASGAFYNCSSMVKLPETLTLKNTYDIAQMCSGCKKLSTLSKELDLSNVRGFGGSGSYVYANCANMAFDGCQLERDSALRVLNTIGTIPEQNREGKTFPLHIGIHIDHKSDEEVLEAITNAESKGWTMTVQWNGTPTSQASVTYGLRKPPIYARVSEHEMPDGSIQRILDWGHYVTDPSGYEEFGSVEAAREYFGLPELEETLTNE